MTALRSMPGLRKVANAPAEFRAKVPRDVVERVKGRRVSISFPASGNAPAVQTVVTLSSHAKVALRTTDESIIVARSALVIAQLETFYGAVRRGPVDLTHKQVTAVSKAAYDRFIAMAGDNPGGAERWRDFLAWNKAMREGRVWRGARVWPDQLPEEVWPAQRVDALEGAWDVDEGLEARYGALADFCLEQAGLDIASGPRGVILREIDRACTDAAERLLRAAEGDYSADSKEQRFPAFSTATLAPALTLTNLFERWQNETKPAASTVTTWRAFVKSLTAHVGHDDASRITPDDAVAWKDALVASGLSGNTINRTHLSGMRALYGYGLANRLVVSNPFVGIKVAWKRQAGTKRLPYSDEEVARLLALAAREAHSYRRWLPLLCACSGARVGEVAQLWGSSIRQDGDTWTMHIAPAPDAGSLKNEGSERTIPIHPALIAAGFLDFVSGKGMGPLFYRKSSGKAAKRHASKGVSNHLADWIRESGFTDPRKAPAHALRHWFKSACVKADVPEGVADHLQGHAGRSEADGYRHYDMPILARFLAKVAVPT